MKKIEKEWKKNPDLRLGQLLRTKFDFPASDPFGVEDSIFGVQVWENGNENQFISDELNELMEKDIDYYKSDKDITPEERYRSTVTN